MTTGSVLDVKRIRAEVRIDLDGYDGPQLVLPMTCISDGEEHAITELAFERGSHGRYKALCLAWVVPGSLFDTPGRPCAVCMACLASKPVPRFSTSRLNPLRPARRAIQRAGVVRWGGMSSGWWPVSRSTRPPASPHSAPMPRERTRDAAEGVSTRDDLNHR